MSNSSLTHSRYRNTKRRPIANVSRCGLRADVDNDLTSHWDEASGGKVYSFFRLGARRRHDMTRKTLVWLGPLGRPRHSLSTPGPYAWASLDKLTQSSSKPAVTSRMTFRISS